MSDDDRASRDRPDDAADTDGSETTDRADADGPANDGTDAAGDATTTDGADADADADEWSDDDVADLPTGDDPVPEDDPFEEMDVGVADGEEAWDDLEDDEDVDPDADRDVRIVSDRTCHNCRFFTDPPETACTHEGTEIRRVVDTDHFEVVDCPMVLDDVDITDLDDEAETDRDPTDAADGPGSPDGDANVQAPK